jgi:predicted RNase H-like HicB family nuclease
VRLALTVEFDRETDGRWIAEILELPGVLAYGSSRLEARSKVEALSFRVLLDQPERAITSEPPTVTLRTART